MATVVWFTRVNRKSTLLFPEMSPLPTKRPSLAKSTPVEPNLGLKIVSVDKSFPLVSEYIWKKLKTFAEKVGRDFLIFCKERSEKAKYEKGSERELE